MNWDQAKGQWTQMKGSVRKQWGKLTDDDLDVIAGERERLVGKIQERYGIAKEEAEKKKEEPVVVRIDVDGIGQRILALPIPPRNYRSMESGKTGILFLTVLIRGQRAERAGAGCEQ